MGKKKIEPLKHHVRIIFGKGDFTDDKEFFFQTEPELCAFIEGVCEGSGWSEYEIKECSIRSFMD